MLLRSSHLVSLIESNADSLRRLKQILAHTVTSGLLSRDPYVAARLVASLAVSDPALAELAFDATPRPTAFAYNVILRARSFGQQPSRALLLFIRMLRSGLYPDRFSLPFVLRACARAACCPSQVHGLAIKHCLAHDPHVGTSLLHSYASRDHLDVALNLFDEMPVKTTVTWNAAISCCAARSANPVDGLALLSEMLATRAPVNKDTIVAALSCCVRLGAPAHGKPVHALATRCGVASSVEVGTSLVHMYANCGLLEYAWAVFDGMEDRDAPLWTAMIGGLAMHGRGHEAVALFESMVAEGVALDSVTFTSVLHACSHAGLIEVGSKLFDDMQKVYGVKPRMEHYGAMVDLLGRAGRQKEAEQVINRMAFEPNQAIWGALLNAYVMDDDGVGDDGYRVERRLLDLGLEAEGGGFYVGVSNMYAKNGRWDEVGRVRERMVDRGVRKERGFSLVEVDGSVHKFLVGDTGHPLIQEIHRL